ncbi:MAG TPA: nucleoside phosphorylase [Firmicutes bacterium]|nr:nucleoside phosphorylase [Bacillota bacterium]
MGITNTFDNDSDEIICPQDAIAAINGFPEIVISVFSQKFSDLLLDTVEANQIGEMTGGRKIPIYKFIYGGKEIGFYHTLLGGSASGALLEEVIAKGGKKILFFGSCGALDKEITAGHLIIPVEAYRDEGTSYHYAPASDYIKICSAEKLSQIFNLLKVPYVKAKTWTTDSFYRETQKMLRREKMTAAKWLKWSARQ